MKRNPNNSSGSWMNAIARKLSGDLSQRLFSLIAVSAAAAYFLSIFDLSYITQGKFWRFGLGDASQNVIGYFAFVRDQWHFPLFQTVNLGYPHGTNIVFTDSIPALSFIFKLLRGILPSGFHPIGLWIFLCFLLLAHAFSSIQYELGNRDLLAAISSALFATTAPFFLYRIQKTHASLCGQFLIAYALFLYLKTVNRKCIPPFWGWSCLLVISLLTHVYLFVMVLAVYISSLADTIFHRQLLNRKLALSVLGTLAIVLSAVYFSGHFSEPVVLTDSNGYGLYSMNLLSPLTPNIGNYDATGGQEDGFNYLGSGILLLLGIAMVNFKQTRNILKKHHAALLVCLLAFMVVAVSNRVYIGHVLLLSYSFPRYFFRMIEQFRASGRFFWPVSYSLFILAVSSALTLRPRRAAIIALAGAFALQWIDTVPIRAAIKSEIGSAVAPRLAQDRWRQIIKAHQVVILLPPDQCAISHDLYKTIGIIAAPLGVPMQSVWAARFTPEALESCRSLAADVLDRGFQAGALYVLDAPTFRSFRHRPQLAQFCSQLDNQNICTLQYEKLKLPSLPKENPILLSEKRNLKASQLPVFLGMGWSYFENTGVWSVGNRSEIIFRLPSCGFAKSLRVKVLPFTGPVGQDMTVSANGGATIHRHFMNRRAEEILVPLEECDNQTEIVDVVFRISSPISALETGESRDARPLGIHLMEAQLIDTKQ